MMQPWETEWLASHTEFRASSTKVSVLGHCSRRIWFSKKQQPGRQQEQTLGMETGRSLSVFSHRRDGLQGLGCQAKQTHKQPAPARPQHFSTAQGREREMKFPSSLQPQSNLKSQLQRHLRTAQPQGNEDASRSSGGRAGRGESKH